MTYRIWRILDANECYDAATREAIPFLRYADPGERPDKTVIDKNVSDASLEELVHLCDHRAENINAHDYVGSHRLLGAVLYGQLGRANATKVMLMIAQLGGLAGMVGIGTHHDAYQQLGVGQSGRDWEGSYGL